MDTIWQTKLGNTIFVPTKNNNHYRMLRRFRFRHFFSLELLTPLLLRKESRQYLLTQEGDQGWRLVWYAWSGFKQKGINASADSSTLCWQVWYVWACLSPYLDFLRFRSMNFASVKCVWCLRLGELLHLESVHTHKIVTHNSQQVSMHCDLWSTIKRKRKGSHLTKPDIKNNTATANHNPPTLTPPCGETRTGNQMRERDVWGDWKRRFHPYASKAEGILCSFAQFSKSLTGNCACMRSCRQLEWGGVICQIILQIKSAKINRVGITLWADATGWIFIFQQARALW
jgi:hypothetical protein